MRIAIFSTKSYDRLFLNEANEKFKHELAFFEHHLTLSTCQLAYGFDAVCIFVNDKLDAEMLEKLKEHGINLIVLRSAGFNHVDIPAAEKLGMNVARVPAYSPHGVAEHAVALILSLNRKIHRAYNRVREGNYSLEGLLGFEIYKQTVGVVGAGKIGAAFAKIMQGFGANVIAYDPMQGTQNNLTYVSLEELFKRSDIVSLHLPLTPDTEHLVNAETLALMKKGVMIINTSRGGLIDTKAVITGLKSEQIGYLGLDVYEEEADLFFEDFSGQILQDDTFARLLTFPNVVITGHQAFFTRTALQTIAETTLQNVTDFQNSNVSESNLVTKKLIKSV